MMAPNAKLDNGSKCQNEDTIMNAKLWRDSGSKRLKLEEKSDSKCLKLMKEMALNAYEGKLWL